MGQEQGVIHLIAPGVHGADDEALHVGQVPGHGGQGGHAAAGAFPGPGQALRADTPMRRPVKLPGRWRPPAGPYPPQPGGGQHAVHQGHQGAAVGQAQCSDRRWPGERRFPPRRRRRFWPRSRWPKSSSAPPLNGNGPPAVLSGQQGDGDNTASGSRPPGRFRSTPRRTRRPGQIVTPSRCQTGRRVRQAVHVESGTGAWGRHTR